MWRPKTMRYIKRSSWNQCLQKQKPCCTFVVFYKHAVTHLGATEFEHNAWHYKHIYGWIIFFVVERIVAKGQMSTISYVVQKITKSFGLTYESVHNCTSGSVFFWNHVNGFKFFKVFQNSIIVSPFFVLFHLVLFYHTWDTKWMILMEFKIVMV